MELRHLRYFLAVAEERHFTRAAERLHMAQPPLSQQIRQLEAELGVLLFERTRRRVELTDAGEAYLRRVRAVLAEVDDAAEEARRVAAGAQGRLVVGCVGSATYSLLPAFARALREELPGVEVSFRGEVLVPEQVAALLGHELDLALLRPPVDEPALRVRVLRTDRLIAAVPDGHRLAARRRLRVADLRDEDLVLHAAGGSVMHAAGGSVMHGVVAELCREAGFEPRVRHEVSETSTLVTFVAAGLGVAVVPEPVADLGVAGVAYRPLTGRGARIDLAAAVRADDRSPALSRAVAVLGGLVRRPDQATRASSPSRIERSPSSNSASRSRS
ncbi:LysR substrate-binding domain-containing protein [Saccharothrix syringae]|uniref:LysR family transcriptional regulator n=1 Tax=Saccharothrix syringae TaxID=103733 RepID=A0A5Q0H0N0_SACSY|nr:LysR substrate-binding domain-containing protein [Saccharothrix syringae]QFZ19729.1 LysR family transcriptional regulator [Saccharothrix syringae]